MATFTINTKAGAEASAFNRFFQYRAIDQIADRIVRLPDTVAQSAHGFRSYITGRDGTAAAPVGSGAATPEQPHVLPVWLADP